MFNRLFRKKPPSDYELVIGKDKSEYWLSTWDEHPDLDDAWLFLYATGTRDYTPVCAVAHIKVIKDMGGPGIWLMDEVVTRKPYRRLGLGTHLVGRVIERARLARAMYLIGLVSPIATDDPDPDFDLFSWYGRLGFKVTQLQQQEIPHNIVLRLR